MNPEKKLAVMVTLAFTLVAGMALAQTAGSASTPAATSAPPSPDPWPKTAKSGGNTYTLYQPQLDDWDQSRLKAHAAVSVLAAGSKDPVFGVIDFEARTHVSRATRTVEFHDIKVTQVKFPTVPDASYQYQKEIQTILDSGPATMPLDRLESDMKIIKAQDKAKQVPVLNNPPVFIFTQTPAILVTIDGEPVWTSVSGGTFTRVLNTRALILKNSAGTLYVHILDGFLTASSLSGPWTVAKPAPAGAAQVAEALAKKNVVDLMAGTADPKTKKMPTLASGAPQLVVATTPTELIVTNGAPEWAPINGTQLLYVSNTTGNVFQDMTNQQTYVLVTGRWFSAPGLTGPWQYVSAKNLPSDFQLIPDDSPKENVKASIPGTTQAQEALISDQIAESADVDRAKATFTPEIAGSPDLKPVTDTTLYYVANSATPIIQVAPDSWYACKAGVWFTATAMAGPWTVAASVPAVIYSIPPSSPIYYVTYVKVYDATPTTVVVGYTPGYMGTVVSTDGVVVYGTGYVYPPYMTSTIWFPPPLTYGYAAAWTYTPWTGWAMGFGFGFAMGAMAGGWYGWGWGCTPYWGAYHGYAYGAYGGAAAWGPGGWAATSGNVYHQWGATSAVTRSSAGYNAWTGNAWSSRVGTSYNSVTGRASAGQSGAVSNAYTGNYAAGRRGASYNPNTGVTTRAGSATAGNAYTGANSSAKWASATGPGGQKYGAADVNGNYYADHDGNVYKSNGNGSFSQYNNGSWNNVSRSDTTQSLQSSEFARNQGEQRSSSAASSGGWGDGFGGSGKGWGSSGGGWGGGGGSGWSHSGSGDGGFGGGGGWNRGGGGGFGGGWGGGWNRGGGGGFGGGRFGGGGFGGGGFGGFRGGGFRR